MPTPVNTNERAVLRHTIENSGIESAIAVAQLNAKIEHIDVVAGYDRAAFYKDVEDSYKRAKVDTVVAKNMPKALADASGGVYATPGQVDVAAFESKIMGTGANRAYVDIQPEIRTKAMQSLAEKHVEEMLNNTAQLPLDYMNAVKVGKASAYTDELAGLVVNGVQTYIDKRVNALKTQLDAGSLTETQVKAMADASVNPQMKAAIYKLYNDPERAKARKEAETKGKVDTASGNFITQLDTVASASGEVDLSQLRRATISNPNFATLPGPVKAAISESLRIREEAVESDRSLDKYKQNEAKLQYEIKEIEARHAALKVWQKRMKWIVGGLALGGVAGAFLGGGGIGMLAALPAYNAAWFNPGTAAIFGLIGGTAGAAIGAVSGDRSDKTIKEAQLKSNAADESANSAYENIKQVKGVIQKRENNVMVAYAKLAALIASMTEGLDKEQLEKAFMSKSGLDHVNEFYQA